jgi:hypothetical protein
MDRRERFAGNEEALRLAMTGMRAAMWTALPGVVVSFNTDDPGKVTAVIQPAIKGVRQKSDGSYEAVNLPVLPDVPVVFPRGGGCTLTFPIKAGDECLVVFSSRCIDAWWQSGGVQLPMEPRMHDLSDGFAILGPQSNPQAIPNISVDAVQLRSDDGATFIELNPTTHAVTITTPDSPGAVILNSQNVQVNGNLATSGNVTVGTGATASFSTYDGQVVTVQDGIIISIV